MTFIQGIFIGTFIGAFIMYIVFLVSKKVWSC